MRPAQRSEPVSRTLSIAEQAVPRSEAAPYAWYSRMERQSLVRLKDGEVRAT